VLRDTTAYVAAIYNAAYQVRHYARGGRTTIQQRQRQQAIRQLGLTVRTAFNESEDFEPLLVAVFDGLSEKHPPPF
jgi:hypothetical protein